MPDHSGIIEVIDERSKPRRVLDVGGVRDCANGPLIERICADLICENPPDSSNLR